MFDFLENSDIKDGEGVCHMGDAGTSLPADVPGREETFDPFIEEGGVAETVSNIPNSRISTNPREGVVVELPIRAVTGRSVLGVGHTIEEASREALDLRDMAERFSD